MTAAVSIFDFFFRRGDPTNDWSRSDDLELTAELDVPSLCNVRLGARLDRLSLLGRSDTSAAGSLCYFDLGITVEATSDETLDGFTIVLTDEKSEFQPYRGVFLWQGSPFDIYQVTGENLARFFGDWYWLEKDDEESIVFYEFRHHEMQVEIAAWGSVKRLVLTRSPLMADPDQRAAYQVDATWPPRYSD